MTKSSTSFTSPELSTSAEPAALAAGAQDDAVVEPPGPSVAVVLPCRNEAATLTAVLEAVSGQDLRPDEIVIVDDGSTDETVAIAGRWRAEHPFFTVTIASLSGRGPAAAMNEGIRRCASEVIVRLDGHCRPRSDYIRRSVETLRRAQAGNVGGAWDIEPGASTVVARAIAAAVSHPVGTGGARYRNSGFSPAGPEQVDTVPFGCFRRSVWELLGGYDEALVANEDFDFNYRLRRAGYPVIFDPAVRSAYCARASLRALARQYFRYGFWKAQMLRKSPAAIRPRQLPPALVLPWIAGAAVLAFTADGGPALLALALYPGSVIAAGMHIALSRRDITLLAPAVAALLTQHSAWSAGFWRGILHAVLRGA